MMKILKTHCGDNADLAALDKPVYERRQKFEARHNGRRLARLRLVSGGPFPICEVSEKEVALDALEGVEVRKR
jgi:hypothetical protein